MLFFCWIDLLIPFVIHGFDLRCLLEKIRVKYKEKENILRLLITFINFIFHSDGVIVDFYLRFYTAGKHLAKLTDVIKTGKLFTHDVHPLFIRACKHQFSSSIC